MEGSSSDPLLHVSGSLLPLLAAAPRLGLPVTVVCPALHAAHPLPPGPSLHPCQRIPGRDLKLRDVPMVLETGQPPPSTGDIALRLLAGACVSLRRVASVDTSLVPMSSWGGPGWWCWGGKQWPWENVRADGCEGLEGDVLCGGLQDGGVGVFAGVGAAGITGPGMVRGWWLKVWVRCGDKARVLLGGSVDRQTQGGATLRTNPALGLAAKSQNVAQPGQHLRALAWPEATVGSAAGVVGAAGCPPCLSRSTLASPCSRPIGNPSGSTS